MKNQRVRSLKVRKTQKYEDTSVGTVTADDLLKACTTNMDDVSLGKESKIDEEIAMAMKDWKPPEPESLTYAENPKWTIKRTRSKRDVMYEQINEDAEELTEELEKIWNHKDRRMDRRLATVLMQDMKMRLELEAEGKECIKDNQEVWYVVPPKPKKRIHKRNKSS
jgi:hypothetical protein